MDYPRDTPLEQCPDPVCRRSRLCRSTYAGEPCRRFYMTADEFRNYLAGRLEALWVEYCATHDNVPEPPLEPSPEGLAILYNALAERAAEIKPEELIPKWARERT